MMTSLQIQEGMGTDVAVRDELISALIPRLMRSLGINGLLDQTLHSYTTSTLQRLTKLFSGHLGLGTPWNGLCNNIADMIQCGGSEMLTADLLDLGTFARHVDARQIKRSMRELDHYRKVGWIPERSAYQNDPRFGYLLRVTATIKYTLVDGWDDDLPQPDYIPVNLENWRLDNEYRIICDERLVRLIWDHVEEHDRIIHLIEERSSADLDLLRGILECDAMALSEGVL